MVQKNKSNQVFIERFALRFPLPENNQPQNNNKDPLIDIHPSHFSQINTSLTSFIYTCIYNSRINKHSTVSHIITIYYTICFRKHIFTSYKTPDPPLRHFLPLRYLLNAKRTPKMRKLVKTDFVYLFSGAHFACHCRPSTCFSPLLIFSPNFVFLVMKLSCVYFVISVDYFKSKNVSFIGLHAENIYLI